MYPGSVLFPPHFGMHLPESFSAAMDMHTTRILSTYGKLKGINRSGRSSSSWTNDSNAKCTLLSATKTIGGSIMIDCSQFF